MPPIDDKRDERSGTKRNVQFKVSSLLFLLTIAAVLAAWYQDHRKLAAQIEPAQESIAVVYALANASATSVADMLGRLYPNQKFATDKNNQIIIVTDSLTHDQIQVLMEYFDRKSTDLITAANPKAPKSSK